MWLVDATKADEPNGAQKPSVAPRPGYLYRSKTRTLFDSGRSAENWDCGITSRTMRRIAEASPRFAGALRYLQASAAVE
jgi:hypothetical protein